MTEQGNDDRAGERRQGRWKMTEQKTEERIRKRRGRRQNTDMIGEDDVSARGQ